MTNTLSPSYTDPVTPVFTGLPIAEDSKYYLARVNVQAILEVGIELATDKEMFRLGGEKRKSTLGLHTKLRQPELLEGRNYEGMKK